MGTLIDPIDYHTVIQKIREYCLDQEYIECNTTSKLSILSSCEDVRTLATYNFIGKLWPLPQSQQMHLEEVLLTHPNLKGVFTVGTSFRNEPNPIEGRHDFSFNMIEIEAFGDQQNLINVERGILEALGYGPKDSFPEGNYEDIAEKYGVKELTHEHEHMLYRDYGPVFILKNFPENTDPFWNMNRSNNGISEKVDIILSGAETFGSAFRSSDPEMMRHHFNTIDEGRYRDTLYSYFGRDRVEKELEDFLKLPFKPRFGMGIGMTRLVKSMKKEGLLNKVDKLQN